MLKLNGKLFRFTCEGTYIYDIQSNFFKKKLTINPRINKINLWKELLLTEKLTHISPKFPFYALCFQGDIDSDLQRIKQKS